MTFHKITNWAAFFLFTGLMFYLSWSASYLYFNRQTIPLIVHINSVENQVVERGHNLVLISTITRRRVCPTDISRYLLKNTDGSEAYRWKTRSTIPANPTKEPVVMYHPLKIPTEIDPGRYILQALIINYCVDWLGSKEWELTTPGIPILIE